MHVINFEFSSYMTKDFKSIPIHAIICKEILIINRSYIFVNPTWLIEYDMG